MKKILLTMTLIMLISTGCAKHEKSSELPVISGLKIETISKKTVDRFYTTSATVKAKTNSVVSSMIMGKVTSLAVQEGDKVTKGQLLLTIDAQDTAQKALEASAGIQAAQKAADAAAQSMKMADRTYQRYKNLYDEKVITKQEFDQYSTQKNVAMLEYQRTQAGVQQARAGLSEVRVYQSYARVAAPISGIITQKNIDFGSTAVQGQPLLTIESPSNMEIVANIDESYLHKVKVGQTVELKIAEKNLKRKITKIVPSVDPSTRTFKAKIDIAGLTGGQFAQINIPVSKKEAILLPQAAVVQKGELTGVYVVDENKIISYRLVKTGKTFENKIEILSGLSDGEKVITGGVEKAVDGGKVQ